MPSPLRLFASEQFVGLATIVERSGASVLRAAYRAYYDRAGSTRKWPLRDPHDR